MTTPKLTYEEWRAKYTVTITEEVAKNFKELHGRDIHEDTELIMRQEYDIYARGGWDKIIADKLAEQNTTLKELGLE
jgi:hypothetical protein